jgi:RND family efflux transporter MFP subunit
MNIPFTETNKLKFLRFGLSAVCLSMAVVLEALSADSTNDTTPFPELDCVIEPSEIVDVGSAVPGVVESILVDRSDLVKQGAVLAHLESSIEQATLDLAKVRAQLNTAIELRQENAAFGYLTQKRNQALLHKAAISMQDMDQLKTETRIAELQVRQEKENKRIAALEFLRAQALLDQRTIHSPVDGVVMERFKSVGEYVENEPLLRVARLNPLYVEVIVPVAYLGQVKQGMQAQVHTRLPDPTEYLATVERVDQVADAASGTFGVRLSLANPDYQIPAGLRCKLDFFIEEQLQQAAESRGGSHSTPTKQAESEVVPASLNSPILANSMGCYRVGPIKEEAQAQQLFDNLKSRTDDLAIHGETVNQKTRYLVLAPPTSDREARHALEAQLQAAGITHRYVILRGKYKGRISLGYYRNNKIATRRQQQLNKIGVDVELVSHSTATTQYWLELSLDETDPALQRANELSALLPSYATLETMNCLPRMATR